MFSLPEGVIDCQLVAFPDASGFLPDASGSGSEGGSYATY
jgi:hypothetical protein